MARTKSYCPYCNGIVPPGERCHCRSKAFTPRPKRKRKPTKGDETRKEREPWRSNYSTTEYRRARQTAIGRTKGRCTDCGRICAWHDGHEWRTAGMGGEVDHVKALSEGGTNDPTNLQLRCRSCHAKRDAARRAGR